LATLGLVFVAVAARAQEPARPNPTLPATPQLFNKSGQQIRVVPIKGFSYPWAIAFLPDSTMLVSERGATTLRIVRNGVLDPKPVTGLPHMIAPAGSRAGVDLALHPHFAENKLLYFTYWKPKPGDEDVGTAVLARGRLDGYALTDVRDLFVAEAWCDGPAAARIVFGRDGKIYMVIGSPGFGKRVSNPSAGQNPAEHGGKVLRLNDDGSVPSDNPFVGRPGFRPEIYAFGIRNSIGITLHPETGEIWATDNGPEGGDEINIIKAGRNYGWPVITYGHAYSYDLKGERSGLPPPDIQPPSSAPGMEQPVLYYVPSIATAGIAFYTGDKFPLW
jgi:glucose/arabinose dehydrogenase